MKDFFEIVFVADPRFPGGTSTALAAEMAAAAAAGISNALLMLKGPALRKGRPLHPEVAGHLDAGRTMRIEPRAQVDATFAIIHHPTLFSQPPAEYLGVTAKVVILVLHHPLRDGLGKLDYRLDTIIDNIEMAFGRKPLLAPVGPMVRDQLPPAGYQGAALTDRDWHNLIDLDQWPERGSTGMHTPVHIGRHSRPHPPKWPANLADALAAYPRKAGTRVSMLGGGDFLARVYKPLPSHWQLREFGSQPVIDYLDELDFFVYFHSEQWVEAFGRSILEALATGLVCILPEHFRPLFGPAAIYVEPAEVGTVIDEFVADPARHKLQSKRARAYVASHFALDQFAPRLSRLRPGWGELAKARPRENPLPEKIVKTVMFMCSNGVGLGHLTRLLAIAESLAPDFQPVFFTLSQGMRLAREAGFQAEYRPYHKVSGSSSGPWNAALAEDMINALSCYMPDVFVFDGNVPYTGVLTALTAFPHIKTIWVRRGFWAEHHASSLGRAMAFDAIIEPGDIAQAFDIGPTSRLDNAIPVPPIVRTTRISRVDRTAARDALGLPQEPTLVALTLGSGSNYDMSGVRGAIIGDLLRRPGVLPVEIVSPIATGAPPSDVGIRQIRKYPLLPYMAAFDAQISACGYNAFHETMLTGTPTMFVPNEADEMDLQFKRARFAELAGASLMLRRHEVNLISRRLDWLLDPTHRADMSRRASGLWKQNGAADAGRLIGDYAYLRKTLEGYSPT